MKTLPSITIVLLCIGSLSFLDAMQSNATLYESNITVRLATHDDLSSIIELDTIISYEHFTPIFLQYPEYIDKKYDVEKMLTEEVEFDATWFASCIAQEDQQRLYVACDNMTPIGFAACHKQDDATVVIDLVMIEAKYRGQGIGKKLMQTCMQTFLDASVCILVVLDKNRQACIAYEKMGFILMD